MSLIDGEENQTATLWKHGDISTIDKFGKYTNHTKSTFKCRWQDVNKLFINKEGKETLSRSIIYTSTIITVQDKLRKGTNTETKVTTSDWEVQRVDIEIDDDGTVDHYKVYL